MWLLKKLTDGDEVQYLVCEKKCYTFGRKNSDVILNDTSISRNHCTINVAPRKECPFTVETDVGVWVIDKKSKYGTYIQKNHEWVRLEEEKVEGLSNGSIIRFGLMENIWRLEFKPIIACTSRLSVPQTQEVKSNLNAVDGKLLSKWTNRCTLLIVNDITLTIKVLLALIHGVPIVTTHYLAKVVESVQQNQCLPDFRDYKPEITESTLVSHLVPLNNDRRELFKGKTFVFPRQEQLDNLKEIIEAAGGSVQLLKLDGNWRLLSNENKIVIQLPCNKIINPDYDAQAFKNLSNVLKNEYHVRVVPEMEIYHAIAYSSIEKYCNPKSLAFELRHSSYNQSSCGDIIEEETPTQSNVRERRDVQQPSTSSVQDSCAAAEEGRTPSRKRFHSPEVEESSKRVATEKTSKISDSVECSDGMDMFCESSNDDQIEPSEEFSMKDGVTKNLEKLTITRHDSEKIAPDVPDKNNQKDSNKIFSVHSEYELDDFWDLDPRKSTREDSAKRKLSDDSNDKDEYNMNLKRKRVNVSKNASKTAAPVKEILPKDRNEELPSTPVSKKSKKALQLPLQEKRAAIDIGSEPWHKRKSANNCSLVNENVELVVNVKNFKKKETHLPQTTNTCAKEKTEKIGKMLLMRGWQMSQCARRTTSVDT